MIAQVAGPAEHRRRHHVPGRTDEGGARDARFRNRLDVLGWSSASTMMRCASSGTLQIRTPRTACGGGLGGARAAHFAGTCQDTRPGRRVTANSSGHGHGTDPRVHPRARRQRLRRLGDLSIGSSSNFGNPWTGSYAATLRRNASAVDHQAA